jgi:REP element-mobilizing transposase RayT
MPRRPRLFLPGATYHVYCRVARGEFVFEDESEAIAFVDTVRTVRDLDGWTVFAWCLMGNHYHLVLRTEEIDLWRSMARLQGSFSRSFNRRHRFLGRLWQSRYRARVIDSEEYFRQAVAYVHLNPMSAGIVSDPADHVFSGHREVIGACRPHIIDRQATLRSFGSSPKQGAAEDYLCWLREVAEAKWAERGLSELPWWAQAKHVDEIAEIDRHPLATTFDGQRLTEERAQLTVSDFAVRMETASECSISELSSCSRRRELTRGRIEFCALAIGRYRLRVCDVSNLLGKHRNSIANWLNEGLRLENQDPDFKARLHHLDELISRRT